MKRHRLFASALLLALVLCGCGAGGDVSSPSGEQEEPVTMIEYPALSGEIQELEPGFSAVRHEGDDGFDRFLAGGGAASDRAVLEFLSRELLGGTGGLELGGAGFGCSTISVENADGGWYFGRNFDWNACDALVVAAYPETGYASISTVNLNFLRQGAGPIASLLSDEMLTLAALYAPLDGMNDQGLCVAVNMIQDGNTIEQDTGKPDLTTTTAIRLLLNQAASVEEALALLEQYDLHASMGYMVHFAIADAQGHSVAVEYIDGVMVVTQTPVLTNFYVAPGEKQGIGTAQSHTRFDILTGALEQTPAMTADQVRDALDSVSKDNFGEFESTEWSVVFDLTTLTATYFHREDYETGYGLPLVPSEQGDQT